MAWAVVWGPNPCGIKFFVKQSKRTAGTTLDEVASCQCSVSRIPFLNRMVSGGGQWI